LSQGIATPVVMALFLLLTSIVFMFLISSWTDQSINIAQLFDRQLARVKTAVDVSSTSIVNINSC